MKRGISTVLIAFCFCFLFSFKAFAAENLEVKATVNGTIEKDKQVEILIDIDNIKSLYAASFYFKYDPRVLRIDEIIPGELISDSKISKFEAIKKADQDKGLVSYGFTCMGNINGFSGNGDLLKLKATVLEVKDFKLTSKFGNKTPNDDNTVTMQICDKDIQELPYNFKSFSYTAPKVQNPLTTTDNTNVTQKENLTNNTTTPNNGESKNNDNSTNKDDNKNTTNDAGEDNRIVKQPMNKNSAVGSRNIVYILGGFVIIALTGFGYYKFKNRK